MDALCDLRRSKQNSRIFKNELNYLNVEIANGLCDSSYFKVLQFILKNANKRKLADPTGSSTQKALVRGGEVQPLKRQSQSQRKLQGVLIEEQMDKKAAGPSSRNPYQQARGGVPVQRMKTPMQAPMQVKAKGPNEDRPDKRNKILLIEVKVEKGVEMSTPVPKKKRGRPPGEAAKLKAKLMEDEAVKRNRLSEKQPGRAEDQTPKKAILVEDEAVKGNRIPQELKVKVEDARVSTPLPEKQLRRAQGQTPKKAIVEEDEAVKGFRILQEIKAKLAGKKAAGVSTLVSEKQGERAQDKTPKIRTVTEGELVKKNKMHQAEVRIEGQSAGKSTNDRRKEEPEVIEIEDDDEDFAESVTQPNPEADKTLPLNIKKEKEDNSSTPEPKKAPSTRVRILHPIKIQDENDDFYTPSGPKDKGKGAAIEQPISFSPFVPSGPFFENAFDDGGETRAFREEVLTVQRKPFNLEEYSNLQEAIIAGSFLDRHEDLKRLLLSQYKREKRLAILRGFFFWLQNMSRKGAFKPWNDCVCLEVDPPHVG